MERNAKNLVEMVWVWGIDTDQNRGWTFVLLDTQHRLILYSVERLDTCWMQHYVGKLL